jgi:hypothetical protein
MRRDISGCGEVRVETHHDLPASEFEHPGAIAGAVAFLASDTARCVTGDPLRVDARLAQTSFE